MKKELSENQYNRLTLMCGYLHGMMITIVPPERRDEFRQFAIEPLCDILDRDPYNPFEKKKQEPKSTTSYDTLLEFFNQRDDK